MRTAVTVLLAAAAAYGLWQFLGPSGAPDGRERSDTSDLVAPEDDPSNQREASRYRLKTGTLEVVVRTPNGEVPRGLEVGYRFKRRTRRLYANEAGRRVFTDAPLGPLVALARAPGFGEVEQPIEVFPGITATATLVLHPVAKGGP